jgi:signal transduction histidine kinase
MNGFAGSGRALGARLQRLAVGSRWLTLAQIGWVLLALAVVVVPIAGMPLALAQFRTLCWEASTCSLTGQLTAEGLAQLQDPGFSLDLYAMLSVAAPTAAAAVWIGTGLLLVWRRPRYPLALLTGAFLLLGSIGTSDGPLLDALAASNGFWAVGTAVLHSLTAVSLGILAAVFPDGRWVPRWTPLLPLGWLAWHLFFDVLPGSEPFSVPALVGLVVVTVWAQLWRFRYGADVIQRQQIKWAVFGFSGTLFGWLLVDTLGDRVFADQLQPGSPWVLPLNVALYAVWLPVPVSIGVAVLRHRLWDIEPIVHRTLVYGALAAFITLSYVAVVVGIGTLVGAHGDSAAASSGGALILSLLTTAAVAVAFQPVREWLQRLVNRLVYGQRASPYEVLANFSRQIAGALTVDQVLPAMAEVAARGVGAQRSRVRVYVPGGQDRAIAWPAEAIDQPFERTVPVLYQGTPVGEIAVTNKSGDPLSPTGSALLADLAAQAGLALSNVRLTLELQSRLDQLAVQADELRASRQRIVAAQDAERRRLERDIHDGAQQQLVAIAVNARLTRKLLGATPTPAAAMLDDIGVQIGEALDNLRDLAHGVFPVLLADRGLVPALRAHVARSSAMVGVEAAPPIASARFDAAIEAAVYFCCLEALQNAAKHAPGAPVTLQLTATDASLAFSVRDEGPGFDVPSVVRGMGLHSMADRLAALDGVLTIDSAPGGPTVVAGHVPLSAAGAAAQAGPVPRVQAATSLSESNSALGT